MAFARFPLAPLGSAPLDSVGMANANTHPSADAVKRYLPSRERRIVVTGEACREYSVNAGVMCPPSLPSATAVAPPAPAPPAPSLPAPPPPPPGSGLPLASDGTAASTRGQLYTRTEPVDVPAYSRLFSLSSSSCDTTTSPHDTSSSSPDAVVRRSMPSAPAPMTHCLSTVMATLLYCVCLCTKVSSSRRCCESRLHVYTAPSSPQLQSSASSLDHVSCRIGTDTWPSKEATSSKV